MEKAVKKDIKKYIDDYFIAKSNITSILLHEYRQDHSNGFTESVIDLDEVAYAEAANKLTVFYKDSSYQNSVIGFRLKNFDGFIEFSRAPKSNYIRIFSGYEKWFEFKEAVNEDDLDVLHQLLKIFYNQVIWRQKPQRIFNITPRTITFIFGLFICLSGYLFDRSGSILVFGISFFFVYDAVLWLTKREIYSSALLAPVRRVITVHLGNKNTYKLTGYTAVITGVCTIIAFFAVLVYSIYLRFSYLNL